MYALIIGEGLLGVWHPPFNSNLVLALEAFEGLHTSTSDVHQYGTKININYFHLGRGHSSYYRRGGGGGGAKHEN